MSTIDTPDFSFRHYLDGGGEMGQLTRSFNWGATAVGTPDIWSQSLLTTVNIILNSKFPMFLWWGPELIQFYNDAYRPSLGIEGKHPTALGQRGEDCWPEIWSVIKPLIDQVMTTGEATWSEDQLIPIYRNNRLEDVYWTFSHSRINGECGKPAGILVICTETTQNVMAMNQLAESEKRLNFMLNAIPQHVWTAKPNGMLDYVNEVVSHDFGRSAAEIIGEGWHAFIHPEDLPGCLQAWRIAVETGKEYVIEFRLLFKDGSFKWHLGRALPLIEDGEVKLWLGTNTNIDLQKTNEQKKDEFLSIASHELRTPMTSLRGSMQLLQRMMVTNPPPEKIAMFVNKANNSVDKLVELLDDLMNVSKIQQGQLALNKTWFNLASLAEECCEHTRLDSMQQFTFDGDKTLAVFADYRRIDQVVVNFVGNAIKYSPDSEKIVLTIESLDDFVKLSVRDFGIGISAEKLPHLFDRYFRVDSSGVQFSGLGLGLYISAEIIKRHGGEIGVESQVGKGSTFWFTLPINGNN